MSERNDTTVTIRPPTTALLCVNSDDAKQFDAQSFRIDTNNPASIYINKQRPLMFGYMSRVALTEVNFEWSTPNVNETNRTLTIAIWNNLTNVIVGYIRIELQIGFYTLPELTKAMEIQLNQLYNTVFGFNVIWKVRWNQLVGVVPTSFTKNFSISIEMNHTAAISRAAFQIVSSKIFRPANQTEEGILNAQIDDLTFMTGLTALNEIRGLAFPYYNIVQGGYPSMSYTPFVDICSNLLTKNQNVSDDSTKKAGQNSILTRLYFSNQEIVQREVTAQYQTPLPISGDPQSGPLSSSTDNAIGVRPFTFRREFSTPKQILWNRVENIDVIDLRVLDRLGNLIFITDTSVTAQIGPGENFVELGNTTDFQFTVSVTEA